jgi:hypothetical protein
VNLSLDGFVKKSSDLPIRDDSLVRRQMFSKFYNSFSKPYRQQVHVGPLVELYPSHSLGRPCGLYSLLLVPMTPKPPGSTLSAAMKWKCVLVTWMARNYGWPCQTCKQLPDSVACVPHWIMLPPYRHHTGPTTPRMLAKMTH